MPALRNDLFTHREVWIVPSMYLSWWNLLPMQHNCCLLFFRFLLHTVHHVMWLYIYYKIQPWWFLQILCLTLEILWNLTKVAMAFKQSIVWECLPKRLFTFNHQLFLSTSCANNSVDRLYLCDRKWQIFPQTLRFHTCNFYRIVLAHHSSLGLPWIFAKK